jgi:LmbE family N-acetylglucosaminyl deacetylase
MAERQGVLCLVHAHPDDESIATGGVILRAKENGHRVVLVTCTGGEEGEIHNLDAIPGGPGLDEIRAAELRRACAILGVDRLELLGYRDSGMAGAPGNRHPDSFLRAPLGAAAARVASLLREERPEVVVTYSADGTYGHPDHVKAHSVTAAALETLRRDGWQPAKAYWHAVPRTWARRVRDRLGSRAHDAMREVGVPDREITTEVDVRHLLDRKRAAVAAHVSQIPRDPLSAMVGQVMVAMGGFEHFVRGGGYLRVERREKDLFAGIDLVNARDLTPASTPEPARRRL